VSLGAWVYCDCYERGRLREPPPRPDLVRVAATGCLECVGGSLEDELSFDAWIYRRACEHEGGVLAFHRLGNLALVGHVRAALQPWVARFPVILGKVVYDGMHGGDWLSPADVTLLRAELAALSGLLRLELKKDEHVLGFHAHMHELAEAAVRVGKPIAF
jgi:hypothetical protein